MSIFSDYKCGAMDYDEFKQACARMNAEERYDTEHLFDGDRCENCIYYDPEAEDDTCTCPGKKCNYEPADE